MMRMMHAISASIMTCTHAYRLVRSRRHRTTETGCVAALDVEGAFDALMLLSQYGSLAVAAVRLRRAAHSVQGNVVGCTHCRLQSETPRS